MVLNIAPPENAAPVQNRIPIWLQRPNQCPPGPSLSAQNVLWSATRLFRLTQCMHLITFPHPCCNPHPLEKHTTPRVPKQEEQRAGKILPLPPLPRDEFTTNQVVATAPHFFLTFSFNSPAAERINCIQAAEVHTPHDRSKEGQRKKKFSLIQSHSSPQPATHP